METFPRYWPLVWRIHRGPANSPHKGQLRGALMFSLICARINSWVNNGEVDDLRRNRTHYDVIVMWHWILEILLAHSGCILYVVIQLHQTITKQNLHSTKRCYMLEQIEHMYILIWPEHISSMSFRCVQNMSFTVWVNMIFKLNYTAK